MAKFRAFNDSPEIIKDIFAQEYDMLKRSARDLIHSLPLEVSGNDRFYHHPFLNRNLNPPFESEETVAEWREMLLLKVLTIEHDFHLLHNLHTFHRSIAFSKVNRASEASSYL